MDQNRNRRSDSEEGFDSVYRFADDSRVHVHRKPSGPIRSRTLSAILDLFTPSASLASASAADQSFDSRRAATACFNVNS